jgi:Leucine-rich repeat (LRR) protein
LTGSLPADDQLASLNWLTKLDVSRNDMEGPIPDALGKLARGNLRFLDLSANRFNGALPNDLFANNLLTHLDVSGNDLDWSSLGTG